MSIVIPLIALNFILIYKIKNCKTIKKEKCTQQDWPSNV